MRQRSITVARVGLLFVAMWANAAVHNNRIQIKVLDSETHSVAVGDNGVPKNCDAVNFDAYCHNSKTMEVSNTLLVQEDNRPPFRISCTVETKWSSCAPLAKGATFDAQPKKHGLVVYYADDNGKVRRQFYAFIDSETGEPGAAVAASPRKNPGLAQGKGQSEEAPGGPSELQVKCSFSSTPAGAEVTVDGKYVGSTPSVLELSVGNHSVEVALPGFEPWKRNLAVSSGSELTVNAILQKGQ